MCTAATRMRMWGRHRFIIESGERMRPEARGVTALLPIVHTLPRTKTLGQILPESAGAQNPLDAIDDGTLVVIGPPGPGFPGWQR